MEKIHLFNTSYEKYQKYLAKKPLFRTFLGEPKETEEYSSIQLQAMGLIGVYKLGYKKGN